MNKRMYLTALIAVLLSFSAKADEGMWLLQLMKQQNSIDLMKKAGLKLEADALYSPNGVSLKDAVGIFGGGCTGEIISPEGLINVTNLITRHPETVEIYYFLQYHLDKQLNEVVGFMHDRGIALKGDIPIGVGRFSVETWTNPELFNMDSQAGAPPDPNSKFL
mgnify:CR=1 FL=1